MKTLALSLIAATAAVAIGTAAQAEGRPLNLAFNVGAASDYVFRGVSQTDENPELFAGVDGTLGDIGYVGAWVSNVDFNNGTDLEYDIYGGIKPKVGPVSLDLGVIRYGYTDQPSGSHETYLEYKAAGSVPVGPATIGAAAYYSHQFFGHTGEALYYEVNGSVPIPNSKFSVSGALGRQKVEGPADYTTWNAGIGYALNDHIGLDLRYWDTGEHSFGDIYDSRVVIGIKATF